jgi:hypothetical protein
MAVSPSMKNIVYSAKMTKQFLACLPQVLLDKVGLCSKAMAIILVGPLHRVVAPEDMPPQKRELM